MKRAIQIITGAILGMGALVFVFGAIVAAITAIEQADYAAPGMGLVTGIAIVGALCGAAIMYERTRTEG